MVAKKSTKRKKTNIGEKVFCKVNCSCKGKCKYKVEDKKINNYTMDFCSKHSHVLAFTKQSEV